MVLYDLKAAAVGGGDAYRCQEVGRGASRFRDVEDGQDGDLFGIEGLNAKEVQVHIIKPELVVVDDHGQFEDHEGDVSVFGGLEPAEGSGLVFKDDELSQMREAQQALRELEQVLSVEVERPETGGVDLQGSYSARRRKSLCERRRAKGRTQAMIPTAPP